jgi:HAE1 family hydrophobic/amphiphilic exporter-1
MNITRLALNRPVTTLMVFVCCAVLGAVSAGLLPLEKFPEVEFPGIRVEIPYAGSTPQENERMIAKPAEEVLATISGMKRMESRAHENGVELFMEFDWGEDMGIKSVEVREKLDGIRSQFPADLERYLVQMWSTADMELLQFRISSNRDLSNAYDMLDRNLKRRIERIEGVGRVDLYGVTPKEIRIELDADRLTAHKVDIGRLWETLRNSNFSLTAGRITDGGRRFVVRPMGEFSNAEDIANADIGHGTLRLKDVANVTYATPKLDFGRHLDRRYAVGLDVFKASGFNTVQVARAVNEEIEAISELPEMEGISLLRFEDQADSVVSSLRELLKAGILGALLAMIVLFFFLRQISTTLIVALAVPVSILITLVFLYFLGLSLNILSLMGLMLAIGMLVDNAVVITESIHQRQLNEKDVARATVRGVKDVAMAVTAGTLTTAIVFLPTIISPKDQITLFLKHVSIAICVALLASLLLSQTIIPLLTSRLKPPKPRKNVVDRWISTYGSFLEWTLRHRAISVLGILVILGSVAIPARFVKQDMFPDDSTRRIRLFYNILGNHTVETVEAMVSEVEDYLFENQETFEIESVYSYYNGGWASSSIYLTEDDEANKDSDEIKEAIRAGLPKLALARPSFDHRGGMGGVEAVSVSLQGESSEVLYRLSKDVERVLGEQKGFRDVRSEADLGGDEVHVIVDRTRAAQQGFSSELIARAVSAAMRGQNLRKLKGEDGEIDVKLAFEDADRQTMSQLKNLPLINRAGKQIALASVVDFEIRKGPQQVRRTDRKTVLSVGATLDGITTDEARSRIETIMGQIDLPTGYSWTFGRRFEREEDAQMLLLVNLLLALALIYIVMAGLFESLATPAAIWTSIIFAIVGVFWFFLVTGTTFSVMAWIGILILIGIVVNNGIVLLDHVIHLRADGLSRVDAVVQGGKDRLRPILMTAGTTVLGLVPLCFGSTQIGGDGPPYFPMARAIVGGLTFSTVITLVVLPTIYLLLDDLRIWARRLVANVRRQTVKGNTAGQTQIPVAAMTESSS